MLQVCCCKAFRTVLFYACETCQARCSNESNHYVLILRKEAHVMKCKCSICGCTYGTFEFKGGYVCEDCLSYIRETYQPDSQVRKVAQNR